MNNQEPSNESLLDREIRAALKAGMKEPSADFTRELMSVIAVEASAPSVARSTNPARLSWTLVALGFAFLLIAILIPGSNDATTSSFSWTGTSVWTIAALALISLLALTQTKPRFNP